jgi:hypothetical protein
MLTTSQHQKRLLPILVLLICLAASLICVLYPIYVIRPFRAQGARELTVALAIMRWRPPITVISTIAGFAALFLYARSGARLWRRIAAALVWSFVFALAILARVNIYEIMFHPNDHPSFATAPRMNLNKDEKVIAVKIGGEARAYPIRSMAYHHLINDVVDRHAIVATY